MTRDIYDQFDAATRRFEAWAILDREDKYVAKVIKTISKSGLQVSAYLQWFGTHMVKGAARGGGYDRSTAAIQNAAEKIEADSLTFPGEPTHTVPNADQMEDFKAALSEAEFSDWRRSLEEAGFRVLGVA